MSIDGAGDGIGDGAGDGANFCILVSFEVSTWQTFISMDNYILF